MVLVRLRQPVVEEYKASCRVRFKLSPGFMTAIWRMGVWGQIIFCLSDWIDDRAIGACTRGTCLLSVEILTKIWRSKTWPKAKKVLCQVAYCFRAKVWHKFVHPRCGRFWIRAPGYDHKFQDGNGAEQRIFDQAADIWAVGATSAHTIIRSGASTQTPKRAIWGQHLFLSLSLNWISGSH